MLRAMAAFSVLLLLAGCSPGPMLGIMSPDAIGTRYLKLQNSSKGYVAFRVSIPGAEPLVTPAMGPGAEMMYEMSARFGTLCPEWLRVEMAAYARVHPHLSPLEDETLEGEPYASFAVELVPVRHYGCSVDVSWVSLDSTIECEVLEVDEAGAAIGFQAGWITPQRQLGLHLDDPPLPTAAPLFPLNGRLVNLHNQPLAGVEILLPQLDASVLTDVQGRFSVLRPAGVYLLEPVLPGIDVSPAVRTFSHFSDEQVPIEFIALTEAIPAEPAAGEQP
jgi:hypothetical protein